MLVSSITSSFACGAETKSSTGGVFTWRGTGQCVGHWFRTINYIHECIYFWPFEKRGACMNIVVFMMYERHTQGKMFPGNSSEIRGWAGWPQLSSSKVKLRLDFENNSNVKTGTQSVLVAGFCHFLQHCTASSNCWSVSQIKSWSWISWICRIIAISSNSFLKSSLWSLH